MVYAAKAHLQCQTQSTLTPGPMEQILAEGAPARQSLLALFRPPRDARGTAYRGSVPTYVQILGDLKRSWYEGDCEDQPCVL